MCFNVDLLLKANEHDRVFVLNDPVNGVDPTGELVITVPVLAGTTAVLLGSWIYMQTHPDAASDIANGINDAIDQAQEKSTERKNYKRRCRERAPSGLDPCEEAKWKLKKAQDCIRLRTAYANRWYGGLDARHSGETAKLQREVSNLEKKIKEVCCGK